ncbi:peptidoglycan recognition protein family protein [Streptomyces spongiae]|uniref:N-acetylmuramoyl-L-alanine amidase n=1 Tax=Streptomyces spongiae TaxID=565072 RepID=A0A5N8XJ48_9ACTN|nr:peptidoglycan recognition family protein [Streptomyces spongiae]MPY59367.1 N-acetylmuramoyl-L-alanine amidase [Streptomyces spongiae]
MRQRRTGKPNGSDRAAARLRRRTLLGALGAAATWGVVAPPSRAAALPSAPVMLSRQDWGADESLRFAADGTEVWPTAYYPVQTLTVHHTADGSTNPDPAAVVRSIYRNQAVGEGWGDIGYHYLIDASGRVYEGRWSGTDGIFGHDSTGRLMVNGAHVGGYNAGNLGIALLGTLTSTPATSAARTALIQLLTDLTRRHAINPLGSVTYRNPVSGATRTVPAISGHRDWAATECPGTVHTDLPAVRTAVADALGG